MTPETLAPLLFAAYGEDCKWTTWDGKPMPPWSNVKDDERGAWVAAAREAIGQMHAALRPTHDDLMVTPESIEVQS